MTLLLILFKGINVQDREKERYNQSWDKNTERQTKILKHLLLLGRQADKSQLHRGMCSQIYILERFCYDFNVKWPPEILVLNTCPLVIAISRSLWSLNVTVMNE